MHQVQDSFSKLSLDGDGVITNIAWHVKSIMQGRQNQGGRRGNCRPPQYFGEAELLLLKLIHLIAREVLLVKKLEIEETKTT